MPTVTGVNIFYSEVVLLLDMSRARLFHREGL